MKIEQEIQQKRPFRSYYQRAAVSLLYTNNWLCDKIKAKLKPHDITLAQYNVLRVLRGAGKPLSTACIRERMIDRGPDTSRLVDRLCKKEWVNRESCCIDKRKVAVTISQQGLDLIALLENDELQMEDFLQNLDLEEAKLLSNLLDKMRG